MIRQGVFEMGQEKETCKIKTGELRLCRFLKKQKQTKKSYSKGDKSFIGLSLLHGGGIVGGEMKGYCIKYLSSIN